MNIAKKLVRLVSEIPIAAESTSREALIDFMATSRVMCTSNGADISYWQASSFGTELEQFLGGKHINQAMVGFLTAIWDESIFVEQTRKGGTVTINNPYFTMLGCCTPGWVTEKLKNDVITDGFSRRVIFALEKEKACLNDWPENSPEKLEALAVLNNECQRIFQIQGQFELSQPARVFHKEQYENMQQEALKYSEKIQSYFTSKHELALKIAMCLSAGIDSSRFITKDVIEAAYTFLEQSERCLETVFAGIGRNDLKAYGDRALEKIRRHGNTGTTKAQFVKENYLDLNKAELDELWEIMTLSGDLKVVNPGSAQDVPRLMASVLDPLPPAVNLLELVRHLELRPESKMATTQAFDIQGHLAPETKQLLDSLAERIALSERGILLRGTRTRDVADQRSPSGTQDE
jgi:hypothetical protein